jgi:hypothetical protein
MSRSYKKHLWESCGEGSSYRRFIKNYANRVVRRTQDVPNGKAYRKYFESWNISDYKGLWKSEYESFWPYYKARMK